MNDRPVARIITASFAVLALAGAGGQAAAAQAPIRAHQHFAGIVNGEEGSAVVRTVCPGPAARHRTGPVEGGQTMAVEKAARGPGDTGPFSQVYAWFEPVRAGTRPVMLSFRRYGRPRDIPRSVRVPCSGRGKAVFSSCPYLAPCAAGFIPDTVKVRFENIAVTPSPGGRHRRR